MTQSVLRTTNYWDRGSSVASGQSVFNWFNSINYIERIEAQPWANHIEVEDSVADLVVQSILENITTHAEVNSNRFPVAILYSTDALADSNL